MRERKRQRLCGYDYSTPGGYFVTVCTHDRECIFGAVENGNVKMNQYGEIVLECWYDLPNHYLHCRLDECIVMPNHFHGIIMIDCMRIDNVGNGFKPFPTNKTDTLKQHGLSEIIRGFKTFSSRRINETKPDTPFRWQKSYYDHIIRNEEKLNRIREYIMNNPQNWDADRDVMDIFVVNGLKPFTTNAGQIM